MNIYTEVLIETSWDSLVSPGYSLILTFNRLPNEKVFRRSYLELFMFN